MPIISSQYKPPIYFRQSDLITIYASKFRRVPEIKQVRERLELSDGDFIDIDWSLASNHKSDSCIILLHGLEGSSKATYIKGSIYNYNRGCFDVCAVNYRSCSGVLNRKYKCYHSGKTDDIYEVIEHVINNKGYKKIILQGFSLGANITLKLVGESDILPKELKAAIAISAPCDLASSSESIMRPRNIVYEKNFNYYLIKKLRAKRKQFPEKISKATIDNIKTLKDFDDVYTSISHGFKNANDYYEKCSSLPLLPNIKIPTYILNAKDDSFLGSNCYPYKEAQENENIYLETPTYGGHVAFFLNHKTSYSENQALKFAKQHL